jgi:hypothetical protein
MKTLITAFLLSILLGLSACGELPGSSSFPTAIEVTASETNSMVATLTSVRTEIPVWTPTVTQVSMATQTLPPAANSKPVIKTTIGDLVIEGVHTVDQVNGVSAGPDEKLILVSLGKIGVVKLDKSNFSLDSFDKALRNLPGGEVHISGDDGSYSVCSMAGWVGPDYKIFAMGFRVPDSARTYQFVWPGNNPIDLRLDE